MEQVVNISDKKLLSLIDTQLKAGRKDENYRYTSLKKINFEKTTKSIKQFEEIPAQLTQNNSEEVLLMALRAGSEKLQIIKKDEDALNQVYIAELSQALKERPEIFKSFEVDGLPQVFEEDLFAQLCIAKLQSAAVIYIPKNTQIKNAIRMIHYFDQNSDRFFNRVILLADEGAEVTYVDEFCGNGDESSKDVLNSGLIEIYAAANAKVNYHQIQNWGKKVNSFIRQYVCAQKDSRVFVNAFCIGAEKTQFRLESKTEGSGAEIKITGAARGDEKQHFDFWVTSHHAEPNCQSNMKYWTVMADEAKAVFNGKIIIDQKAVQTDANQSNRNMLLSQKANINTIPKLEISTDDVKCSHGVTVSPVEADQLFYLESRGISQKEAEYMIINGFTEPVVSQLPTENLQNRIHDILSYKHSLDPQLRKEIFYEV